MNNARKHQRMFNHTTGKVECALCARSPDHPWWDSPCPGPEMQSVPEWLEQMRRARAVPEPLEDLVVPLDPEDFGPAKLRDLRIFLAHHAGSSRTAGVCLSSFGPAVDDNWYPLSYWDGTIWNTWGNDHANYPKLWAHHGRMEARAERAREQGVVAICLPCVWVCAQCAHVPLDKYLLTRYIFPGSPRGLSRGT